MKWVCVMGRLYGREEEEEEDDDDDELIDEDVGDLNKERRW